MSVQEKKRLVSKLDFITAPGWLEGGRLTGAIGIATGHRTLWVITNMAVMDFEPESKWMRVISINPGYTFDDIQSNCEFELLKAPRIFTTKPPTAMELRILRDEIDPNRQIIGR